MGKGENEMISILFESEELLKETNFGFDLVYQPNIKLLKRTEKSLFEDINIATPDVLFLGIKDNSIGLIDKIKSITIESKKPKIFLLLNYYSDHICWFAKKFKIDGIMKISSKSNEVLKLIDKIVIRQKEEFCSNYKPTINYEHINEILSDIEKSVFKFVGKGLTTQEISELLNLSKRTVDNHRAKILKKLNCKHASKLVYISTVYNLFNII